MALRGLVPLLLFVACGHPSSGKPAGKKDAGAPTEVAESTSLAPLQLGKASIEAYAYRKRAGHASFKLAREAEERGDWVAAQKHCEEALAADADHLDASYLLAVAHAKQNQLDRVMQPLATAVAGDFSRWGQASLEQPALQAWLGTPSGQAWRARVQTDRDVYVAAIARSIFATADGDVFAFDVQGARWYRITRTAGAVVGVLPMRHAGKLAYVTREREKQPNVATRRTKISVGLVDLGKALARRPVEVNAVKSVRVGYSDKKAPGFIVRSKQGAWQLVDDGKLRLVSLPPKSLPESAPVALDMEGRKARHVRTSVENVTADWDKRMLASAIRINSSNKTVTVPSPGLIDGGTAQWSPDKSQLAFVAQLTDACAPTPPAADKAATPEVDRAVAYVADAATGLVTEIERAKNGIAVEWFADRKLAVAGDAGVRIIDLGGGDPIVLAGAEGLAVPKLACPPASEDPEKEVESGRTEE